MVGAKSPLVIIEKLGGVKELGYALMNQFLKYFANNGEQRYGPIV